MRKEKRDLWPEDYPETSFFPDMTGPIKGKIDKLHIIKIKTVYSAKDLVKRTKTSITGREKIFANYLRKD